MNFIAANLLFHSEEFIAFWLLVMLFEIFELRDIYLPSNNHKKLRNFENFKKKLIKNTVIKIIKKFKS